MGKRFEALLAPAVLVALAVLLANDFLLKPALHDALTGKLSDFAGLFLFVVFWCAIFPRHRNAVAILTALGFIVWKSPAAQPLIDAWNGLGLIHLGRVVDPTDLLALVIVPIARAYRPRPGGPMRVRRVLAPGAAAACVFAFAATSQITVPVPVPGARYEVPLSREVVLRRIYELRLSFVDRGVPPGQSADGPDELQLVLPPSGRPDRRGAMWRAVRVRMSVADAPGGGSILTLINAAGHEGAYVGPTEARRQFELRVLEPLQRNEVNTLHAVPYVPGTEKSFTPRIVAPRSLAESRARVTITLNRPAFVALVEVTPDEHWRLLYPTRPEDERRLGPGTHTLVTACAGEPETAPIVPDLPIAPCARARPVTPREVGLLARKNIGPDCRNEHVPGIRAGTLALIATDRPLRRATLEAQLEGYCGFTYFLDPGVSPLVRAVHASGTRKWAAAEVLLRR